MCPVITTDFSTPFWKSACRSLVGVLALVWVLLALPGVVHAQNTGAEITQLQVERTDSGVFLSAQMKFELSTAVEDALLKGIAVHFVAQAQLLRDRWYWYDKKLITATKRMRLTYQPLTQRWKLSLTQGGGGQTGFALNSTFDTLPEALQSLTRLSRWKIAEASDVDPDSKHNVDFTFRLDSSELPRPLQIGILGQSDWTLTASRNQRVTNEVGK